MSTAITAVEGQVGEAPTPPVVPAPAWARFWARLLDSFLEGAVVSGLFALAAPRIFLALATLPAGSLVVGILVLPFVLLLDAAVLAVFGQTPGKALAGVRLVTVDQGKPRFRALLRRNANLYVRGLALGLPVICLAAYWAGYEDATSRRATLWDRAAGTRVAGKGASTVRVILTAALTIGLVGGSSILGRLQAQRSRAARLDDAQLGMVAARLSSGLPRQIDSSTRLDGVGYSARDVSLTYTYSLLEPDGLPVPREIAARQLAEPKLEPKLRAHYCTDARLRAFREHGVLFRYRYQDADGTVLKEVAVTPEKCARVGGEP